MISELPFLTVVGLGFLLGAKHALDADHVVAISTIATEQRSLWRSSAIGFCWGVGHTLLLLLAGLTVLCFKFTLSAEWARLFDTTAGVMLVGLSVSVVLTL